MIKQAIILTVFSIVILVLFIAIKGNGSPKCCVYHIKEYQAHNVVVNNTTNVVDMTDEERKDKELLDTLLIINLMNNSVMFNN